MSRVAYSGFGTHEVRAAGTRGTFNYVGLYGTNTSASLEFREQDGSVIAVLLAEPATDAHQRAGVWRGQRGIRFNNGLDVVVTDRGSGGTVNLTLNVEDAP